MTRLTIDNTRTRLLISATFLSELLANGGDGSGSQLTRSELCRLGPDEVRGTPENW